MTSFRIGPWLLALMLCLWVASVQASEVSDASDASDASGEPLEAMTRSEPVETEVETRVVETALSWSDLTRLAREHQKRGELDEALERLTQAALQVGPLPPTHARRRTVFGLQARLAMDLANAGEFESADELADELLAQAESEPELGGAALVELALSVADRRQPEPQLSVLRIALKTAQAGASSRDRMNLAFRVAEEAYREKDLLLARQAIDQAVLDSQHIGPSKRARIASLELYKARVALAQMDLEVAEKSATDANRIFEEISASSSRRGIAEATLAEILATKGETDKALLIAHGAHARIGGEDPIQDHAQRVILTSLGRVERKTGDRASAQAHFEQALAIPAVDFATDIDLVEQLTRELRELNDPGAPSVPPPAHD
jgi:tetratricopeptide (TPR) repeat protein